MARWLAKIEGERFDTEEFPYWFPDGDVHALEIDEDVYLVGPRFERLSDPTQVYDAALQVLDEFFAIISLLQSNLARPRLESIIREHDDGHREQFVFGGGTAVCRSKARGRVTVSGEQNDSRARTQAQTLLSGLGVDTHLDTAICLWADPARTWPRLYRILEDVEHYLGQSVSKAGLCADNQRERFTRCANDPATAGADARHAARRVSLKDPMDLKEATRFISGLLQIALARAASAEPLG